MKKIIALLLVLVMTFSLAACTAVNSPQPDPDPKAAVVEGTPIAPQNTVESAIPLSGDQNLPGIVTVKLVPNDMVTADLDSDGKMETITTVTAGSGWRACHQLMNLLTYTIF